MTSICWDVSDPPDHDEPEPDGPEITDADFHADTDEPEVVVDELSADASGCPHCGAVEPAWVEAFDGYDPESGPTESTRCSECGGARS